jgi:predicted acyl esterase
MKRFLPVALALLVSTQARSEPSFRTNVPSQTVMIPMRDGAALATDLFFPAGAPPFPVLLIRTPYNKAGMTDLGINAAKHGYAAAIQDTRGRFASQGDNLPFNIDDKDGFDTVEWIARQGWCNGKIGTTGGSALGITQLQLAGSGTERLACQHITVAAPNLYDVVYCGGVFRKALVEDWLRTSQFSPRALQLWTGHSVYDRYWWERDVSQRYGRINAPAVHIGGYFDIFAQGTLEAFLGFQEHGGPGARGKQKLLLGPWTHGVLTDKAGDLVFPGGNHPPNNVQDQYRWFERYLKGVLNGVDELPAVTYYVMGDVTDANAPGNVWRTADRWPPVLTRNKTWYFHSDLSLSPDPPAFGRNLAYAYDPANPAPTVGGYQLTIPAGPRDQRAVEDRADVLVLTSAPLTVPIEVTGNPRVKLRFRTDVPDTDFIARLCDVYPDGRSFNICEGMIRTRFRHSLREPELLKPGKVYAVTIDLWPTSIIFNKGHSIRVDLTSSSAPGYDPNPNTGERFRWSDRQEIAHQQILLGAPRVSELELPIRSN